MELNDTQMKSIEASKKIKEIFGDRIGTPKIYDVVHENNHYQFRIGFTAYESFSVVFQYEMDIIGCYFECGRQDCISLVDGRHCYSDTDLEAFFKEVRTQLELRVPDKFLKAKGWA